MEKINKLESLKGEEFCIVFNYLIFIYNYLCVVFYRGVSIKSMKAIFPYEHNFTEAVQNELISITKWLKIIHRKQKVNVFEPLPSDLVIKVSSNKD